MAQRQHEHAQRRNSVPTLLLVGVAHLTSTIDGAMDDGGKGDERQPPSLVWNELPAKLLFLLIPKLLLIGVMSLKLLLLQAELRVGLPTGRTSFSAKLLVSPTPATLLLPATGAAMLLRRRRVLSFGDAFGVVLPGRSVLVAAV